MRRTMVFLLILVTTLAYSQQSNEASNESKICFSVSEMAAFEAAVQEELQRTAVEAAEAAVKPYLLVIEKKNRQLLYWKIGTGTAVAAALVSLVWAALK